MDEEKCWICKRGFVDVINEFNEKVLSSIYIDDEIKARYEKGKIEFFPYFTDKFIKFEIAEVEKNETYSLSGKIAGEIRISLCPVCSGLLEMILDDIEKDIEEIKEGVIFKEDLENVSITIN